MVVVVVLLQVTAVGCGVVVDCVVLMEDVAMAGFGVLVVEAKVVAVSLTEAVVVSC